MSNVFGKTNILVVQQGEIAHAGALGQTLDELGATRHVIDTQLGQPPPQDTGAFDALLVLGGVMSAVDDEAHPWLTPLTVAIRRFHAEAKPVLGICLGAQVMARAFGARVHVRGPLEIGFRAAWKVVAGEAEPLLRDLPRQVRLLQWHTDTFDLPAGAELLMTNASYPHQCYRVGDAAHGFQFHFEITAELAEAWADLAPESLEHHPGGIAGFRTELGRHLAESRRLCGCLGRRWLALVERKAAARAGREVAVQD